jgi:hypothetical protein
MTEFTAEETKGLFYQNPSGFGWAAKWYNMDVMGLPIRPPSERYTWNIKNHWLERYHSSRNHVIFLAHCALDACGFQTPKYLTKLCHRDGIMWVHDTCFDLSHIPEYHLCLKTGMALRNTFSYAKHGCWSTYVEAHMLRAIGRHAECIAYIRKECSGTMACHKRMLGMFPDRKHPTFPQWHAELLRELGATPESD